MTTSRLWLLTYLLSLTAICLFLPQQSLAAKTKAAGYMILAGKGTKAISAVGKPRSLSRKSSVYQGDTIITGQGFAQIRFADGGLTSLRPQSRFKIEKFHWAGKQDGTEKGIFALTKGGLRTITGKIGKINKQNYRMRTPVATIGIRGTHYRLRLCFGDCPGSGRGPLPKGLFGGVIIGGIRVGIPDKPQAAKNFGPGEFFNVVRKGALPKNLLAPPGFMTNRDLAGNNQKPQAKKPENNVFLNPDQDSQVPKIAVVEDNLPGTVNTDSAITTANGTLSGDETTFFAFIGQDSKTTEVRGLLATISKSSSAEESKTLEDGIGTDDPSGTTDNVVTAATFLDNDSATVCNTCSFSRVANKNLNGSGGRITSEFAVNGGLWESSRWTLTGMATGFDPVTNSGFVFVRTPNATTATDLASLGGIATFNKNIDGTAVDHLASSSSSSTINSLSFNANFGTQKITDFAIDVSVGSITTGLVSQAAGNEVSFFDARESGISLSGNSCTGCGTVNDMLGTATVEFLGKSALSAMGAFELHNTDKSSAIVGVYIVDQE